MAKYQAYPEYKDSGVEWLGKIPSDWSMRKLAHAYLAIGSGTTPTTTEEQWYEGDIPWVTTGELREAVIYDTQKKVSQKTINEYPTLRKYPVGSVIIAMYGATIGRLGILGVEATTNQACCVLTKSKEIENQYLFYWLQAFKTEITQLSSGGGQPNINQEKVATLKISCPEIKEQKHIVSFLNYEIIKIDSLIDKQHQLIDFLKEKRQALISSAVTKGLELNVEMKDTNINWLGKLPEHWRVNKLRNLFTLGTGLSITRANLTDEGVPCVSYGEVHSRYGFELDPEKDSLQCVDQKYLQTAPRALLNKGDFIFADTSEDLKGSGNFTHLVSDGKVFAGYHTIIVRPLDNAVSRFYAYLFESDVFRSQIQLAVKGVKVYSITQAILKNATVWLPPKEEKLEIANYLDEQTAKIDTLIQKAESAITLMQERRTALISAAVTGKIDVRNWQAPVTSEVTE